jgi:hypothetical protein
MLYVQDAKKHPSANKQKEVCLTPFRESAERGLLALSV